GVQIGSIDYLSDTLLIGSGTSYPYSVWAWTKAGDGSWTLAELGADNPADDGWEFADTAVITGPNASFCLTSPCELTVLSTYQRAIVAWSTSDGVGSEELDLLGDYFYNFQINDQGYVFAEASTQFAMWIFNGTSWNVSTVAKLGGIPYNDPIQSENSADAFVQEASSGTIRVLRLHFDGELLAKTTLASDAALTGGGRGGYVHGYRTGSGGAPLIWRQGGSLPDNATYTEIELPLPAGATLGRVMDINEAGVAVGYVTDSSSVDHPAVWQPTSPTTYSVSEPNGQVIQGGIDDLGDDNVAFTSYYDGLFGFYPYGGGPFDYESYRLTDPDGSYLYQYNSSVRDADADHFVGKVAAYDLDIGSVTRPGFWALSDLDLGTYQIPATLLDTPGGPVEGGILEQTADGCVLGFANGGDLYQWVNGVPEPLDTGIYYTVSYATSAPGHRHFANASGPNGDVVLELVCSGGTWTTVELSKGNFTDTMVEYFDGETQTLRGRDTLTYNALYWSLGGTAPRVIAYFDDDGTGYGDASPRARGSLVGAMLYDSANGRFMAGVFDPQPTGDDDMTVTVLGGLQPGQSSAYVDNDGSSRILGTIYGPGPSEVSIGIWTLGTSGWQLTNVVPGYEASAFIGDGASAVAVGTQYGTYVAIALESVNGVLTPTTLFPGDTYLPYLDAGLSPNLRDGRTLGYFTAPTPADGLLFFRTVDGHIETFTAPGAPTDYNGAQAVAMLRPGVFLVYETNPEFSYQDAYIYTFGTGGEMVRTLVDTGEYAA
ncbi:MAG: hypothetical protein JNJ59_20440, partial [Deltaproteobacteria bacterium]|nr:hypothetical protein [Deltaproteobacteria bacterium]